MLDELLGVAVLRVEGEDLLGVLARQDVLAATEGAVGLVEVGADLVQATLALAGQLLLALHLGGADLLLASHARGDLGLVLRVVDEVAKARRP